MKTRTAPWDYERNPPIIPQKVKLCALCGGWIIPRLIDGTLECLCCGGSRWAEVMEGEIDAYRASLREPIKEDPAMIEQMLADMRAGHVTPPDYDSPAEQDAAESASIQKWLDDNRESIPEIPL